jgi:hypothetical protein
MTEKNKGTRFPRSPRVRVAVTAEHVATAIPRDSGHCMIADAVRDCVPGATNVAVDIQTVRFSDPAKGLRYVYLTPQVAAAALVDFDDGTAPAPFEFELRGAWVLRVGGTKRRATEAERQNRKTRDKARLVAGQFANGTIPRVVGGKEPPQMRSRREFGRRAFRARPTPPDGPQIEQVG